MMRVFFYLFAAIVAVHSAPSGLSSLSERESSSGSIPDPATISTAPFVTFGGHLKRALLSARFRSAPAIKPYIVQTVGDYSFDNCYTDSTSPPALNGKSYSSDSMSLETCASKCDGFPLFGIKNGRDCYCGNALQPGSVPEPAGSTTHCDMACNGNPFEYCGGAQRLQIYTNTAQQTTSTASTTGMSSMSSTSTMSTSSSTSATPSTSSTMRMSTTASTSVSSTSTASTMTSSTSSSAVSTTLATSTSMSTSKTSTTASSTSTTSSITSKISSTTSTTSSTSSTISTTSSTTSTTSSTTSKISTSTTTSTTSTTSSTTLKTSTTSTTTTHGPTPTGRAMFAHYLVVGITQSQANTDIQQAQAMGLDGFALNVATATASWSNDALQCLFNAASGTGFKLFLSIDMTRFSDPSDAIPLIQQWHSNPSYYKYKGLPFVSTFDGGTLTFGYSSPNAGWQAKYRDALNSMSIPTYFVPVFDDSPVDPSSFFNNFPVVDGLFAWENSWPYGSGSVSSSKDQQYFSAAQSAGKSFMMGISAVQFKHMQSSLNYYRTGGLDLALRISQILSLGPDFVQIQSWNDAGESHYIGPVWSGSLSGTNVASYTDGYDHSGWQILLKPVITAYKSGFTDVSQLVPTGGAPVQGVFWHSTLLSSASCYGDNFGKPSGSQYIQDTVEVAVIIAGGVSGVRVDVYSGNQQIGSYNAVQGLNAWEVQGLRTGQVKVVVTQYGQTLISGTGSINVAGDSNNCNYNPQVVGLS